MGCLMSNVNARYSFPAAQSDLRFIMYIDFAHSGVHGAVSYAHLRHLSAALHTCTGRLKYVIHILTFLCHLITIAESRGMLQVCIARTLYDSSHCILSSTLGLLREHFTNTHTNRNIVVTTFLGFQMWCTGESIGYLSTITAMHATLPTNVSPLNLFL